MQHSQSAAALGANKGSWADIKKEEGMRKRSNTAQNLQFYVEEQKRLYHELPFMALPGMRRQSFQRERSFSNIKSKSSWGSFTNLVSRGEEGQALLGEPQGEPGYTVPLLLSCCVALVSAFQFGFNTGVTGALNSDLIFPDAEKSASQRSLEWSICVSIFAVGGPIGSLFAGQLSQTYGRKRALIIDSFLFILAGALMAFANNIYWLMAGRFIVGFAAGTVSVVVPLYLGELAPPNLRGALGTGYQFGVVLGILAADLLAFGFSDISEGFSHPGWRFMFGFTAIPALLQLALASFLTESPRWLLTQNKPKEAAGTTHLMMMTWIHSRVPFVEILRRLRGTTDVYEEIDSICSASDNESSDMSVWEVLLGRSLHVSSLFTSRLSRQEHSLPIDCRHFAPNLPAIERHQRRHVLLDVVFQDGPSAQPIGRRDACRCDQRHFHWCGVGSHGHSWTSSIALVVLRRYDFVVRALDAWHVARLAIL
ncbi:hypothetical protein AC1031_004604 [Aphanomyces cochlioides]|nr:hypothetical protein AC1031_004604 [Aphanomyces cochlioides]